MLQIIIINESNTVHIKQIRDLETMDSLAVFDEDKKCIDLSVLESHIGEPILVTHFYRKDGWTRLEYEHEKTLTKVDTDDNGVTFIEYN